jgi:hypothetical protein
MEAMTYDRSGKCSAMGLVMFRYMRASSVASGATGEMV